MAFSDRRLVFVLDNIERLGSEKMLFLLKTVADVLNLDRVTYILSYDPRIMERLLTEQKYDMEYLKKIVQMEFCVPELDTDLKNDLMFRCVDNMLTIYGIEGEKKNGNFKHHPFINGLYAGRERYKTILELNYECSILFLK